MRKVAIVYTTKIGETEKMAEVIAQGVRSVGGTADLLRAEPLKAKQGIRDDDLDVCRAFGMKLVFGD